MRPSTARAADSPPEAAGAQSRRRARSRRWLRAWARPARKPPPAAPCRWRRSSPCARLGRARGRSDAPLAAEDVGHLLEDGVAVLLVLAGIEGEELKRAQRGGAGRRRDVRAARVFAFFGKELLPLLAHPELVEQQRGVRVDRALQEAGRAELGRNAFLRENVVGACPAASSAARCCHWSRMRRLARLARSLA